MRGLGHFLGILPHVGVGHGDAVVVGVMDEEVRRLAIEDQSLGAILLNLHHEPIGHPTVITVAEALSSHGNGDGAIVHMANLKGNLASGGHGAEFFVAHGCYSIELLGLSIAEKDAMGCLHTMVSLALLAHGLEHIIGPTDAGVPPPKHPL